MDDLLLRLSHLLRFTPENLWHLLDILLVTYLIYRLLILVRNTRAWRILLGIVVFVAALFVSDLLQLRTLHWVLDKATALAPVALVILLLPELRQALEGFARLGLWTSRLGGPHVSSSARAIDDLVAGVTELAQQKIGAIIIVERATPLSDIIANGVPLDAQMTPALLNSIFFNGNPLHDGAAIVRGEKVIAAACQLPLSVSDQVSRKVHMRHRAGIGMSEQSDCLAIIVSEERGTISIAAEGRMTLCEGINELREILNQELRGSDTPRRRRLRREAKRAL
ncbi:MAG: TIGR00159 family protein [Chthonomonas sp.]|nr:TIGR00159 family protein [Chthonomonas sp.]